MQYIRADANPTIATGHIMRCMAIGKQIQEYGEQVTFIVADNYPCNLLSQHGFPYIVLNSDWRNMEEELPVMRNIAEQYGINSILVDSYQVTERYFTELKKIIQYIYFIDDNNKCTADVTGVINYSHYFKEFGYGLAYQNSESKLWLGCDFIPLRKEFSELKDKVINSEVRNVMVTTGGSDYYKVTDLVIETLASHYVEVVFHVVVGCFFQEDNNLLTLKEKNNNVILYHNISSMANLMKQCDMAISAGGTTLYELCATGVPTICFSVADNQLKGTKAMEKDRIMLYIGDIRDGRELFCCHLNHAFEIIQNRNLRQQYSNKMKKLVDGEGSKRIAGIMLDKDTGKGEDAL
ncbi:MAG: pseG [Firmicutes bacterium]|nr:pseG [Bacillota bacterium]